jgi:uncharacterized membrane protein
MPPSTDERLATFLGWFSLGLGAAQLSMPGRVNALAGIEDDADARRWQRIVGIREVGAFVAIQATGGRHPAPLWGRVAGDAKDLTLLAFAWREKRESPARLAATIGNIAAVTALDLYTAQRLSRRGSESGEEREEKAKENGHIGGGPMHVKAAVTVKKPRQDVYGFWRDLENLPSFMGHLESVRNEGNGRSHWKVKAPAGANVEWDAEMTADRAGELIAWHSLAGASIENSGRVRFLDAPGNRGTEVHVEFDYDPPVGRIGELLAKAFGEEPTQQAKDDLRRFKQVMETGFVVRSEGSPEGSSAHRHIKQRPAQPLPSGGRS